MSAKHHPPAPKAGGAVQRVVPHNARAPDAGSVGKRNWTIAIVTIGVTLATYNGNVDGNLDLYHEGSRLAPYDALQAGRLPFRDVFIPQGLGENVLKPLLACRLYGSSVEAVRRLGQNSFIYRGLLPPLGVAAMLLAMASLLRDHRWFWLFAPLPLLCLYEITERHTLGFLAAAAVGRFAAGRGRAWLGIAGSAAGLAALYSLEVGLYLVATIFLWLVLKSIMATASARRGEVSQRTGLAGALVALVAGLAIVAAPFVAWCMGRGILGDFIRNANIQLFMRRELLPLSYPTPAWNPAATAGANVLVLGGVLISFYVIPLLYGVVVMMVLVRPAGLDLDTRSRLLFASLLGGTFWATVVSRPDFWHVAAAVPAFVPFAAVVTEAMARNARGLLVRAAWVTPIAACVLTLAWIGQGGVAGRVLFDQESVLLIEPLKTKDHPLVAVDLPGLGDVRIRPEQAGYLVRLVSYVQSHTAPDDTILDLSDQALLYFLCQRQAPTRYHLISYCGGSSELRGQVLEDVLSRPRLPRYVITYTTDRIAPDALGKFIAANYAPETAIDYTQLLRLREAPSSP